MRSSVTPTKAFLASILSSGGGALVTALLAAMNGGLLWKAAMAAFLFLLSEKEPIFHAKGDQ